MWLVMKLQGLPNWLLEKLVPPRCVQGAMMEQQGSSHILMEKLIPHEEKRMMGASLAVPHPHGVRGLAHRQWLKLEPQGLPNRQLEKWVQPQIVQRVMM